MILPKLFALPIKFLMNNLSAIHLHFSWRNSWHPQTKAQYLLYHKRLESCELQSCTQSSFLTFSIFLLSPNQPRITICITQLSDLRSHSFTFSNIHQRVHYENQKPLPHCNSLSTSISFTTLFKIKHLHSREINGSHGC